MDRRVIVRFVCADAGHVLDSHAESVSRIIPADLSHVGSLI